MPPLKARGYVHRQDFIENRCRGKRVLDLGMVAATCEPTEQRIQFFPSSLHFRLAKVTCRLVGVDHAQSEIDEIKARFPNLTLYAGDVQELTRVVPIENFDVVVMGNLIEHLSNPGLALDQLHPYLTENSEIIVTCPNGFGLPRLVRFCAGLFQEGLDHVQSYTKHTLANLLTRHGYQVEEVWTGVDRDREGTREKLLFKIGSPILRHLPEVGGTLIIVARPAPTSKARARVGESPSTGNVL